MTQLLPIIEHTPRWVWVVLALLIWLGIQGLRPRRVALARIFITPAVFILWGLVALGSRAEPPLLLDWGVTAAIGMGLAVATLRLDGVRIASGFAELPGSWLPLVRNLTIFAAKYVLAVAMARNPDARATLAYWDIGVSGLSAGYFIGWTLRVALRYRATLAQSRAAQS
jgi:hypothetical protein